MKAQTRGFAGVSLHLDSLGEAFGYPGDIYDPAYHQVLDRFQRLCDRFGFRGSVFVIGRDLQERAHRNRLRWLADKGHEIANHSWSHYINLGAMSTEEMRFEVRASHFRIADCIGHEPKGFVAPAWSYSERLIKVLLSCGYEYDSSLFPTPLLYGFLFKNALNHRNQPRKLRRVLDRKDWMVPLKMGMRDPFLVHGQQSELLMLPMPVTAGPLGMAVWHTTGFVFGWRRHFELMEQAMSARRYFNYVIHPADLLGEEDVPIGHHHSLERLGGSWHRKFEQMTECFRRLVESGKELVTLREMSWAAREALTGVPVPERSAAFA